MRLYPFSGVINVGLAREYVYVTIECWLIIFVDEKLDAILEEEER